MLYWDSRISQAQVADRLKDLSFPKLGVYVVGCVTHARNAIAASHQATHSEGMKNASKLLERFWAKYPQSLQADVIEPLAIKAADLLPGEEGGPAGWEDALIWGIAYSFSLVLSLAKQEKLTKDAYRTAIGAVDRAYWAIYAFHHEQNEIQPSEDQIRKVEMKSPVCNKEIEFQLALLTRLEESEVEATEYADLTKGI